MSTTSTPVRVGLAGLGRFGKLHASVLSRLASARLAAICDPLESELQAAGDRYNVERRYQTFDELVADPELDCFFIVTPEDYHAEHARKALGRGLPVFMEKPLATTSQAGAELVALAERSGAPLQIGFVLRFDTQYALVHDEIHSGRFGDLISLRVKRNCSRSWFDIYGDRAHSVYETVIHDIDAMLWFTGSPVESVYALDRNVSGRTYPEACFALLRFANGATGIVETSWFIPDHAPANVWTPTWSGAIDAELEVVGTKETARIRLLDAGISIWSDEVTRQPETGLWPELHGNIAGALSEEDAHFIECVRTGTPSTVTSIRDAAEGLRIAEAIVESAATGQVVRLR